MSESLPTPSKFSASQAKKFMNCHASANLAAAIPHWVPPVEDPDADNAANRGTHAHELLAEIMKLGPKEAENFSRALGYVADIQKRRRFKRLIEEKATAWWLPGTPETTVDLVLYVQDEIHVIDWKWGKIPVEVQGNEQLQFYAVCFAHLAPKARSVTVHIVQPAADNMDSWFVDALQLDNFMRDSEYHAKAIANGHVGFNPGDWCTFCPANPHSRAPKGYPMCPAQSEMLYPEIIDEDEILGKR